jgi:DNA-binding transcriptional regulator YdaS (Cro superfamily)
LLHDPTPLTDDLVDSFLTAVADAEPESNARVRSLFAKKVLASFYPTPVRQVESHWSFGRWIEAARVSVGLTSGDVALTVSAEVTLIERLERSDVSPWEFKPALIADLACLFRVHITALEQMFSKSTAVARGHATVIAAARSVTQDPDVRAASSRRALDLYLAANSCNTASAGASSSVFEAVRKELESRKAFELLQAAQ